MLELDGVPIEQHKRIYPHRWKVKYRAWPVFWKSLLVIPFFALIGWLSSDGFDRSDTAFCIGWITAHFWFAVGPYDHKSDIRAVWTLDGKPPLWARIKEYFRHD